MAFDGIVTKAVTAELSKCIINGKIDKIHQPDKNSIIVGIYSNSIHYALNICIDAHNCRINLTTNSKPNPLVAPNFCMLLRKHIIGGRISKIEMVGLERLVKIYIDTINEFNEIEPKVLICELMGKHSNIILLNSKNTIIDALRHINSSSDFYRDILPQRTYSLPTSNKKDFTQIYNFDDFYTLTNNISTFDEISNIFTGFSKSFIKSSILKCNINSITRINLEKLYIYISQIVSLEAPLKFEKIYKNNKLSDYSLVISSNNEYSLNNFIDNFYFNRESIEKFTNYKNNILKIVSDLQKKYTNRLININSKLNECSEMDTFRLYGELITANLYRIPNTHSEFIEIENYYDNNNLIKIPLDIKYLPNINAKRYFKKYNKLKNAFQVVSIQKKDTEQELNYIESILYEIESAQKLEELQDIYEEISENMSLKKITNNKSKKSSKSNSKKKVQTYSPIHCKIDDYDVYIGKNNKENDWLTLSFAKKTDIWFHTKDIHGSHVILKTTNMPVSDDTLVKCAKLAAKHSKANMSSNVPVDYCKVQYIKKPAGSKPGMVIFTNNKTIYVNP